MLREIANDLTRLLNENDELRAANARALKQINEWAASYRKLESALQKIAEFPLGALGEPRVLTEDDLESSIQEMVELAKKALEDR